MLLRLLSPEQRKKVRKEYFKRYGTLTFSILSGIIVLYVFSLAPTLFISQSEYKIVKEQVRIATDPIINRDKNTLRDNLRELNRRAAFLDEYRVEVSSLLDQVTRHQLRTISLASIVFEVHDTVLPTLGTLVVQGSATNREQLADFVSLLETSARFESVTLPFSSFARNQDIPFSITIVVKRDEGEIIP